MLVKVKGITEDGKDDWLYIGEVEELQVSDIIHTTDLQRRETATTTVSLSKRSEVEVVGENEFIEDDYWMFSSEMFKKNHEYMRIACTKRDGHMVSVVFNTVAYICNDSCKTIEKHVVNEV